MAMASAAGAPFGAKVRVDDPATITGAIYTPSEAYNAPQTWKNFNPAEADRDLGQGGNGNRQAGWQTSLAD